mgnify:CR=1 FL=1
MDTHTPPSSVAVPKRPASKKRRFTAEFKAHIIELCSQPGAVRSQIAREHDLIPNMVNRWMREHRTQGQAPEFVPVEVAAGAEAISEIRIECIRGQQRVSIAWPASAAKECAQWLREWLA